MSHHYIRFEDVRYHYENGLEALCGVSFQVNHSEKVAIVGANGAGKSTLMLHMNGLLMATSGQVLIGGIPITKQTVSQIHQNVGFVFQDPDCQLFMSTVEEDVAFGPSNMQLSASEIRRRVDEALMCVGVNDLRHCAPNQLSEGQKKKVSIATVLSTLPNILVLDEPTSSLDARSRRQLIDLLKGFHHTIILGTHDLEMVLELCNRMIVLDAGKIVADGNPHSIFLDLPLLESCGLEQPYSMRYNGSY